MKVREEYLLRKRIRLSPQDVYLGILLGAGGGMRSFTVDRERRAKKPIVCGTRANFMSLPEALALFDPNKAPAATYCIREMHGIEFQRF